MRFWVVLLLVVCGLADADSAKRVKTPREMPPRVDNPYYTRTYSEALKTLQVYREGDDSRFPILTLGSDEHIVISFDELSHDPQYYAYRLIHCDAHWQPSRLNSLEFLEGFPENYFPDGEMSRATSVAYTHYELRLPNTDVRWKLSGNYAVEIFDRYRPREVLATVCFSVLEPKVAVEASVSHQTELASSDFSHQQVDFDIVPPQSHQKAEREAFQSKALLPFADPQRELSIVVRQNRRRDNEVWLSKPYMMASDRLQFRHFKELAFWAGNEYRRFEVTHFKQAGLGVERIDFERPDWQVWLYPAHARQVSYSFDKDHNGRFRIASTELFNHAETEADYAMVHFAFPARLIPENLQSRISRSGDAEGDSLRIYVSGALSDYRLDDVNCLVYNEETECYERKLQLKQGSYDYYFYCLDPSRQLPPTVLEGNFWQTENQYQIFVYYRPAAAYYDALIGYLEF